MLFHFLYHIASLASKSKVIILNYANYLSWIAIFDVLNSLSVNKSHLLPGDVNRIMPQPYST